MNSQFLINYFSYLYIFFRYFNIVPIQIQDWNLYGGFLTLNVLINQINTPVTTQMY